MWRWFCEALHSQQPLSTDLIDLEAICAKRTKHALVGGLSEVTQTGIFNGRLPRCFTYLANNRKPLPTRERLK